MNHIKRNKRHSSMTFLGDLANSSRIPRITGREKLFSRIPRYPRVLDTLYLDSFQTWRTCMREAKPMHRFSKHFLTCVYIVFHHLKKSNKHYIANQFASPKDRLTNSFDAKTSAKASYETYPLCLFNLRCASFIMTLA